MKIFKINESSFEDFDDSGSRNIAFDLDVELNGKKHTLIFQAKEIGTFDYSDGDYLTPSLTTLSSSTYEIVVMNVYDEGNLVPFNGIKEQEIFDIIDNYYGDFDIVQANKILAK